jgi:DNA polymerase
VIDVTAYYPSLQKQFKIGYRVMDNPENFEFIHDSNIAFKRKGDKKARQPFKIMDNAISGQMKQPQSALYDPMSNNTICINGQLLLLDLVEHLEPIANLFRTTRMVSLSSLRIMTGILKRLMMWFGNGSKEPE